MKQAYFIAGTDTGIGKTLIASALIYKFAQNGFKAVGMKPVAAGCSMIDGELWSEDVTQLIAAGNVRTALRDVNPYAFAPAIAPHIAATQAGVEISLDTISQAYTTLTGMSDIVIVEGVGGFCVPLGDGLDTTDLAQVLGLPIIMVVGMRLGCLNHALLTVEAISARGLALAGWVANVIDPGMAMLEDNISSLKQRIQAPCLGVIPWQPVADVAVTAGLLEDKILKSEAS